MNRWRARRQASENDEQGDRQVDGEDGDGETRRWKMEGARVCVCVYLELQVVTSRFMGKINVHLGKLNGKANRVRAGKFKYAITRFVAAVPPPLPGIFVGKFRREDFPSIVESAFFWRKDFSSVQQIRFLEGSWNWIERMFYENRINHIGKE